MLKPMQFAGILFLAVVAGAANIVTTRASVKVYPNPIRRVFEQPLFVLEKGEVVEVLQWGNPLTRIRNRKGRTGYAESALLDSLHRPPILRLMIDSSESTPAKPAAAPAKAVVKPIAKEFVTEPAKAPVIAKDTASAPVKAPAIARDSAPEIVKSASAPETAAKSPEKPVDFQGDSAHITPRSNADTAKK